MSETPDVSGSQPDGAPASPPPSDAALAARVVAFAAPAALSTVQDTVRATLPALQAPGLGAGVDPDLVAEETLALVATVTARAAETGLQTRAAALAAAGPALLELPFLYHDFLLGAELVAAGTEGDVEPDQSVYARLERKAAFYDAHLPVGRFPGPRALGDVLALWMGRVSPPKLPTTPYERLDTLGLTETLAAHARLVLAFAQRASGA